MWKKDETPTAEPVIPDAPPRRNVAPRPPDPPAPAVPPNPAVPRAKHAAIGPSITIKGEVSGDEDLLIEGTVEGSVDLGDNAVQVGPDGRVKANISARVVTVEGEVEGDLRADDQIVLRPSAHVKGDITAPRVVLEDGARFRGMVEMGESASRARGSRPAASDRPDVASSPPAKDAGKPEGEVDKGTGTSGPDTRKLTGTSGQDTRKLTATPGQDTRKGSEKSKPEPAKVAGEAR